MFVIGNTTYSNLQDTQLSDTHAVAECDNASASVGSVMYGNICFATQNFSGLDNPTAAINEYNNLTPLDSVDWDDAYNSASTNYTVSSGMPPAFAFGPHIVNVNPGFANPDTTEPTGDYPLANAEANYAPSAPAVLKAVPPGVAGQIPTDIDGHSRCLSTGHTDMGAVQVSPC